jgi:hypothetical protein
MRGGEEGKVTGWFGGDEGAETSTCELDEAEESGGSAVEKGFSSSKGSMWLRVRRRAVAIE